MRCTSGASEGALCSCVGVRRIGLDGDCSELAPVLSALTLRVLEGLLHGRSMWQKCGALSGVDSAGSDAKAT